MNVAIARNVALVPVLTIVFTFIFLGVIALAPLAIGWQPHVIATGSMQPVIQPGWVVLVAPVEADQHLDRPTIVAFDDRTRGRMAHRVVGSEVDAAGQPIYTTKGDANRTDDRDPLPHDEVVGTVRMVVPFVGLPALWVAGSGMQLGGGR